MDDWAHYWPLDRTEYSAVSAPEWFSKGQPESVFRTETWS